MLFNSYEFIFVFFPIVFGGIYALAWLGRARLAIWLAALASLVFYGAGDICFVPVLLGSAAGNYLVGNRILAAREAEASGASSAKAWLILGIAADLGVLGYFKYTNFLVSNLAAATGWHLTMAKIVLPIGISFYTFTQIAFLVDCARGEARRYPFGDYLLFVTYFPHLVAGPILDHKRVMPQFAGRGFGLPSAERAYGALVFFCVGLFKKVVVADSLSEYVAGLFPFADTLSPVDAWLAALLYTFQLYYDFSGYSEMAVGLALFMNVEIPINFDSPYKATSIIEFWRHWHISLSTFLRDYLYIPLGGNRKGPRRRYVNLLSTMLLGGLWHGAGWTFLVWGALHGVALAINHLWRGMGGRLPRIIAQPLTLLFAVIAWVVFRAPDIRSALDILAAMVCLRGSLPSLYDVQVYLATGVSPVTLLPDPLPAIVWVLGLGAWCIVAPNTQQIVASIRPRMAVAAATAMALIFVGSVMNLDRATEFLYFQF